MISTPGDAGDPPVTIDPAKPNYGFPSGSTGIVTIGGIKELRPDGCDLAAVSLASGATVASFDAGPGVPTAHCDRARLSPDGRLVAVTVDNLLATGRSGELRVLDPRLWILEVQRPPGAVPGGRCLPRSVAVPGM